MYAVNSARQQFVHLLLFLVEHASPGYVTHSLMTSQTCNFNVGDKKCIRNFTKENSYKASTRKIEKQMGGQRTRGS